jgi:hypothetical protein
MKGVVRWSGYWRAALWSEWWVAQWSKWSQEERSSAQVPVLQRQLLW